MPATVSLDGSESDVFSYFEEHGWTDGLPIVAPTKQLVETALSHTDFDPGHSVGSLPPGRADATVHTIAVNAVMAGCRPEYLPIVIAAVEAIAKPEFNLYAIQSTTNPVTPLVLVNGPLAAELGFNAKGNCFGPGARANATVGRAIWLCMLNIGGGTSQTMDKATHGQPGKYGLCIAENDAESPWPAYSESQGFESNVTTVSVFGVTGTQNMVDVASRSGAALLRTFAGSCAAVGGENFQMGGGPLLVLSPEHAQILAKDGYSKQDVSRFLYEAARLHVDDFSEEVLTGMIRHRRPRQFWSEHPRSTVAIANSPEEIRVVVAGGPGAHSVFLPIFGEQTRPVTVAVTKRDGSPLQPVKVRSVN